MFHLQIKVYDPIQVKAFYEDVCNLCEDSDQNKVIICCFVCFIIVKIQFVLNCRNNFVTSTKTPEKIVERV